MCGDAGAAACGIVVKTVIFADDFVAFHVAQAERDAAMIADVARGGDGAVGEAIEDDALIEEAYCEGFFGDLAGVGDGIPEDGECAPVGFCEGAFAREWGQRAG